MLRSEDLLCYSLLCGWGDVWLPWKYGEVGVDAKCAKSLAMHAALSSEEAMCLLRHRVDDQLPGCMAKGVYLLAQGGSSCRLCCVVREGLGVSCHTIQGV